MNISGFYQSNHKSINNTSLTASSGSNVPPKINNTTEQFTYPSGVNFSGINITDASNLQIDGAQIGTEDLADGEHLVFENQVNTFTELPIYKDENNLNHSFLVAAPDTSLTNGNSIHKLTLTKTTHDQNSNTHTTTTSSLDVPKELLDKHEQYQTLNANQLAYAALDPDGPNGPLTHTLARMSPYKVVTGNSNGALIGMYIYDNRFKAWVMGVNSEQVDTTNMRENDDLYKHGLVPEGAAYVVGSTQEFLRKDGSWQSINLDLGNIDTHLVSAHNNAHDIGSLAKTFKTLYINDIELEERINLGAGRFLNNNQIGDIGNQIPWGYFQSVVVENISSPSGTLALNGILTSTGNVAIGGDITANNLHCANGDITASNFTASNRINTEFIEIKGGIFNHLVPFINTQNNTPFQELGDDTHHWNKLYIETIKVDYIHPHFVNSGYLGKSDNKWGEAHIQTVNCSDLTTNNVSVLNRIYGYTLSGTQFEGNIYPENDVDRDIGSTSKRWKTVNCQSINCDNLTLTNPSNSLIPDALTCSTLDASNSITASNTLTVGSSCVASTWAGGGSYATFRHKNNTEAEKYALLSDTAGNTYVNGGTAVYLRVNNDFNTQVSLTANGLTTTENFTCENINCGNVGCANIVCDNISTPVHLTHNIGAQNASFNVGFITHIFGSATNSEPTSELQLKNRQSGGGFIHIRETMVQSSYTISPSDRRIKKNITPYVDGWEDFKNIQVRTYTRFDETKQRVGVVADEIRDNPVLLISNAFENTGTMDLKGETYQDFGSVGYETLYRMNLRVTQQLQTRVEELEAKLNLLLNNNNGQASQ